MDHRTSESHTCCHAGSEAARDMHHALLSLEEELQAVDAYGLRIATTKSPELRAILIHNRDEEKEHAAMLLEWMRRRDETWDHQLHKILMQDGPVAPAAHLAGFAAQEPTVPASESR